MSAKEANVYGASSGHMVTPEKEHDLTLTVFGLWDLITLVSLVFIRLE